MHPMTWHAYYRSGAAPEGPSAFAKAVEPLIPRSANVLDVGCGKGRDTFYFVQMGHSALGADPAVEDGGRLCGEEAGAVLASFDIWDVIYMRWFLHAVWPWKADQALKLAATSLAPRGILAIEARSANGHHPDDHARWPVDPDDLRRKLESLGLTVESLGESTDFSPVGDDRPLLLRCLARRPELDDRRSVADGSAAVQGGPDLPNPVRPSHLPELD
jgi:SAM-dependent methyltransferase